MILTGYDLIYLMSNIFGTFIIFKFMTVFFDRKEVNKKTEFLSYFIYYLTIGAVYILFDTPVFNLVTNLVLFFVLTLNYEAAIKRRLAAVVYIYAILISVEAITIIGVSIFGINKQVDGIDLELILSLIVSKILSYIVVLLLANFKMIRAKIHISILHWIAIFFIPLSTLTSTALFMVGRELIDTTQIFISIAILFIVNIFVFYIYDNLLKSYEEKIDKNLLIQQNNAYMLQIDIINESNKNLSIIRHDFRLHLSALSAMIEKGDRNKAQEYIETAFSSIDAADEYAKTGNTAIDGILNYKIQAAKNLKVEVELDIQIPEDLNFQPFDLVAVLGNLLDNALEAVAEVDQADKKIKINMLFDRNILYITVMNPYQGNLVIENNSIKTRHEDADVRGYGLKSITKTLDKYNGSISVSHEDNMFRADVLLYDQ